MPGCFGAADLPVTPRIPLEHTDALQLARWMGEKRDFQADFDQYRSAFPEFFEPNRDSAVQGEFLVRLDGRLPGDGSGSMGADAANRARMRKQVIEEWIQEDSWGHELPPDQPASEEQVEKFGGHPGGLVRGFIPNAFYLPFHRYHTYWGCYIYPEGVRRKNRGLRTWLQANQAPLLPGLDWRFGLRYLIWHEYYHHRIESFGTRMEAVMGQPFYRAISARYQAVFGTDACHEEACANCNARERVVEEFGAGKGRAFKHLLRRAVNEGVGSKFPGYRLALHYGADWETEARVHLFEDYLACLPEGRPGGPVGDLGASKAAWMLANYLDSPICPHEPMVWYLLQPDTALFEKVKVI